MTLARTCPDRHQATAAVEFALVSPLLLVLLLGLWEVGCMVEAQQVLNNAAREGARQGSTGQKTLSEVQAAVTNYIAASGFSSSGISVTVTNVTQNTVNGDPRTFNHLDHFRVDVVLPFNNVRWILLNRFNTTTFGTIPTPSHLLAEAHWHSMKDQTLTVSFSPPIE
jgi:Flp pilus assembly protein TadG